jgi:hypothetical protein
MELVPTRTRTALAKPKAASTTRSAAGGQLHGPANDLALVKTNASTKHRMARRDRLVLEHLPPGEGDRRSRAQEFVGSRGPGRSGACWHSWAVRRGHQIQSQEAGRLFELRQTPRQSSDAGYLAAIPRGFPRHAPCGTNKWKPPRARPRADAAPRTELEVAEKLRQTPLRTCDIVPSKESAMWNWLVRLWRKIDGWMHSRAATPKPYRPSNLHGRHR